MGELKRVQKNPDRLETYDEDEENE